MIHERGMMKQSRRERARLCVCVHMDSGYSKIYFKKNLFFSLVSKVNGVVSVVCSCACECACARVS